MTITEFPPQRRTIVTDERKTHYIYLPKTIFIEPSLNSIILIYEYQNEWFSFHNILPNIERNHICFSSSVNKIKIEPSINNFWHTMFHEPFNRMFKRLYASNWWEFIKYDPAIYNKLAFWTDNLDVLKFIIQKKTIDFSQVSINATVRNHVNIINYIITYKKNLIDIDNIFRHAIFSKSINIIELLLSKISVSQENINKYTRKLLEEKNANYKTLNILHLLLQHGANNYDEYLKEIEKMETNDVKGPMKRIVFVYKEKNKEKNNGNY